MFFIVVLFLCYVKACLICLTKIKERTMTQKKGIAKVSFKMRKMKEKAVKVLIAIAKKGLKNDLESTGSSWTFQPVIPNKKKTAPKK